MLLVPLVCALHLGHERWGYTGGMGRGRGCGQARSSLAYTVRQGKSLRGMANALVGEKKKNPAKKGPCPGLSRAGQLPQCLGGQGVRGMVYLQQRGKMQELGSSCERRVAEWPSDDWLN